MTTNTMDSLSYTVDCLADRLTEILVEVNAGYYADMSEAKQWEVKTKFYESIKKEGIIVNQYLINVAKSEGYDLIAQLLEERNNINPVHSKYSEAYKQLTRGRKVTIIKFTEFGFPYALNTTIEKIELQPYAQHRDAMKITHKPKGKRTLWANWLYDNSELIVYDGWLNVDIDKLSKVTLKENKHMTMTQSKYCSFDNNFIVDILQAIPQNPIVQII